MQKNVRCIKSIAQLLLRKKSCEANALADAELARELLQLALHRPFAGDREARLRILLLKCGEGAQAGREAFFLDQAAGLQKFPSPVLRPAPRPERDLVQRNAGAMKPDFLVRAAKRHERAGERLRADEHEPRRSQHLVSGGAIMRLVQLDQHVRAMKRNHRRSAPVQHERQKMDRDVPEINVQQLRLVFVEQLPDLQHLAV